MAQLQAQLKRGILDELWNVKANPSAYLPPGSQFTGTLSKSDTNAGNTDPQGSGISLQDTIRAFKSARYQQIQSGTFIVNSSGSGGSVSFLVPEIFRQLGPDQFFMLGQEFLEILSDAVQTQASTTPAGPIDDQSLYVVMASDPRLQTVTSSMVDTTSLRWPTYGPSR